MTLPLSQPNECKTSKHASHANYARACCISSRQAVWAFSHLMSLLELQLAWKSRRSLVLDFSLCSPYLLVGSWDQIPLSENLHKAFGLPKLLFLLSFLSFLRPTSCSCHCTRCNYSKGAKSLYNLVIVWWNIISHGSKMTVSMLLALRHDSRSNVLAILLLWAEQWWRMVSRSQTAFAMVRLRETRWRFGNNDSIETL